jgi:hypothetical protein
VLGSHDMTCRLETFCLAKARRTAGQSITAHRAGYHPRMLEWRLRHTGRGVQPRISRPSGRRYGIPALRSRTDRSSFSGVCGGLPGFQACRNSELHSSALAAVLPTGELLGGMLSLCHLTGARTLRRAWAWTRFDLLDDTAVTLKLRHQPSSSGLAEQMKDCGGLFDHGRVC